MYYRPRHVAPLDLGPLLAGPLGDAEDLAVRLEDTGYSGQVYRISSSTGGRVRNLILKGVPNPNPFLFYLHVLAPYRLHSPHMLGLHRQGTRLFVILEYFPHREVDWGDPDRYRRAVDWLVYKDATAHEHLDAIRQLGYIRPFEVGDAPSRLEAIAEAARDQIDPRLSTTLVRHLQRGADRLVSLSSAIRRGPQTVTHNDYQMLNILFGDGEQAGELRVVDWTDPAIGSVYIDLATLLHVAPGRLRGELCERYRTASGGGWCPVAFAAARAHVHLSILLWMIDALRSGQGHTVSRAKMEELVESLQEFVAA